MTAPLSKFFLGGTVVNEDVLYRAQTYADKAKAILGVSAVHERERHITIIPPFFADFQVASEINRRCAAVTLLSRHPLVTTEFRIKGIEIMTFGEEDIICFKLIVHKEAIEGERFSDYVLALRKGLEKENLHYKEKIPEGFTPHITLHSGKNLRENKKLAELIRKSQDESAVCFRSGYPTLYAKYKEGWKDLRDDPLKS